MELNLRLHHDSELIENKKRNREFKKQRRKQIIKERLMLKLAQSEAERDEKEYVSEKNKTKFDIYYDGSILEKIVEKIKDIFTYLFYYMQTKLLYVKYALIDILEFIKYRKLFYILIFALVFFPLIVGAAYDRAFGVEITLNGHIIGVTDKSSVYHNAMNNVKMNLINWSMDDSIHMEETVSMREVFITKDTHVLSQQECEEAIYSLDVPLYSNGGIILIDGVETIRLGSMKEAEFAIDGLIDAYIGTNKVNQQLIDVQMYQDIKAIEKVINISDAVSVEDAVKYLMTLTSKQTALVEGELPESEGSENEDHVLKPDLDDDASSVGKPDSDKDEYTIYGTGLQSALTFREEQFSLDEIIVKPALTIKTVKEIKYVEEVPFTTTFVLDDSIYVGTSEVQTKGQTGQKEISAVITYLNGKESSKSVLDEKYITAPVNEVIARGSMLIGGTSSTGVFVLPAGGLVTTLYGYSSHAGGRAIDIASSTNTPIHAADAGVVVRASWYGTYGECIEVKHENGYSTLYAHLNEYNVQVGDAVSQGQVIAGMGTTGYSTGTHLHFEIRLNDQRQVIDEYFDVKLGLNVEALMPQK